MMEPNNWLVFNGYIYLLLCGLFIDFIHQFWKVFPNQWFYIKVFVCFWTVFFIVATTNILVGYCGSRLDAFYMFFVINARLTASSIMGLAFIAVCIRRIKYKKFI